MIDVGCSSFVFFEGHVLIKSTDGENLSSSLADLVGWRLETDNQMNEE